MKRTVSIAGLVLLLLAIPAISSAQTSQAPPKVYTGNFGAGLSLTRGNSDTANFNLSGELTRDPKTKNVIKFSGLYLRSSANTLNTTDRLTLAFRDQYALSKGAFVYGAMGYLRDPFRDISYLLNPQGGFGYKPLVKDRADIALSGGAGAAWEKNPGTDVHASGSLNAGENFTYRLTETSKVTQGLAGLWKTSDFNDALYHFDVAVSTALTKRAEMRVEFLDDFKNVTPGPTIKKNDTAFIVSFLYKF
jgi:putative salt-induced outer membrane protein